MVATITAGGDAQGKGFLLASFNLSKSCWNEFSRPTRNLIRMIWQESGLATAARAGMAGARLVPIAAIAALIMMSLR